MRAESKNKNKKQRSARKNPRIPVIDVFAGAGGLGEGFAEFADAAQRPFQVRLSVECDKWASETLKLRAFYHSFPKDRVPEAYYSVLRSELSVEELYEQYQENAAAAELEVVQGELGGDTLPDSELDKQLRRAISEQDAWVLVGGPPCQAYSVAGRVRNKGKADYVPENDHRHFLYQEYLGIIARHWPKIFVMENVKGILTAKVGGENIFPKILEDLTDPLAAVGSNDDSEDGRRFSYRVHSLVVPSDFYMDGVPTNPPKHFIIESEKYGIPQARHRVILLGVRDDIQIRPRVLKERGRKVSVRQVLEGMPKLRAVLSKEEDTDDLWRQSLESALEADWLEEAAEKGGQPLADCIVEAVRSMTRSRRSAYEEPGFVKHKMKARYAADWYLDERVGGACNSGTRAHMRTDLHRYLYASCYAKVHEESPRLKDFPAALHPDHKNLSKALKSGHFHDRFRVQLESEPSTTVVSHISKDGHYFIHYDPSQARSLTVREAARLQTFKDNFFFMGPRTEQYRQVGNAVPPLLSRQIADVVYDLLQRHEAGEVDG